MQKRRRNAIPFLLLVLLLSAAQALAAPLQVQGPRVRVTLDAGVLRLGEQSQVTISVEGTRDARLRAVPTVEGVIFGEARPGLFQSIVNGRRSVEVRYTIPFRVDVEGELTLPPFVLEVDGQQVQTRSLDLRVVRDLRGEDLGFLEVRPNATRVVEGQPISVELVLGLDTEMEYARPILPWWEGLPGTVDLESRPQAPGTSTARLLVNRQVEVEAESLGLQERDGRVFKVFRLERRLLPVRSGSLRFPVSHVEFGRLQEQGGFFSSRSRPVEAFYLSAEEFTVEVVALPTDDQPVDFGGAVGSLDVRARTDTRDVRVGDSIKLTVDWEGEGNLEFFDAPDPGLLDAFRGFRVYGKTEEKSADRRRVVYDLAPTSEDADEIPPLPLVVFDPEGERYETLSTEPIPIRVRALEGGSGLVDAPALETVRDIHDLDPRPLSQGRPAPAAGPSDGVVAASLIGLPLGLFALRTVVRRRRGDPARPAARRRRAARRGLQRALASDPDPAAASAAFAEFLGARTGEPGAAWEGRDLEVWSASRARPLPAEVVARLVDVRERLDAAVYGSGPKVRTTDLEAAARSAEEAGL